MLCNACTSKSKSTPTPDSCVIHSVSGAAGIASSKVCKYVLSKIQDIIVKNELLMPE